MPLSDIAQFDAVSLGFVILSIWLCKHISFSLKVISTLKTVILNIFDKRCRLSRPLYRKGNTFVKFLFSFRRSKPCQRFFLSNRFPSTTSFPTSFIHIVKYFYDGQTLFTNKNLSCLRCDNAIFLLLGVGAKPNCAHARQRLDTRHFG